MRNTMRSKPAAAISCIAIPSGAAWRAEALREGLEESLVVALLSGGR